MTESCKDTDMLLRYATVRVSILNIILKYTHTHQNTQLAEMTNRFDDMATYMRKLCSLKTSLTLLERSLLSVAYKNAVGKRRNSLRRLSQDSLQVDPVALKTYGDIVRNEIVKLCSEAIDIANDLLSKNKDKDMSAVDKIFLMKMVGDYNRYMGEFLPKDNPCVAAALKAYSSAMEDAKRLRPSNATRLGLALNFSVFHLEVLGNNEIACALAQDALNRGADDLEGLGEKEYRNTAMIMELIGDNIALWTERNQEDMNVSSSKKETSSSKGDALSPKMREGRALSASVLVSPQQRRIIPSEHGSSTPPPLRT